MPRVGFELIISADERPKTYVLDRAATGTGTYSVWLIELRRILTLFVPTINVNSFVTETGLNYLAVQHFEL